MMQHIFRYATYYKQFVTKKTMIKVVHRNVSQSCKKIRKSKSKKIMQPINNIQVILCDLKNCTYLKKKLCLHNVGIQHIERSFVTFHVL